MKYYGIKTESNIFVVDALKNKDGEIIKGNLVYKKKSEAISECDELNEIRHKMKLKRCYSVSEITDVDVCKDGIIVDGIWREKL